MMVPQSANGPVGVASAALPVLDRQPVCRFCEILAAHPARRIERDALWTAFQHAFPTRPDGPEGRRWFRAALEAARASGVITFPAERGPRWDRTAHPPVPRSVDRVAPSAPPRDDRWRREAWHPSLAWVADLPRVTDEQVAFLRRVHEGLTRGAFRAAAPMKYRSLELTGHEKRLADFAHGQLFAPGRLTLDLLGCLPDLQPIVWEAVGPATAALVLENAEPFRVALERLRARVDAPYGIVAWGGGTSVSQAIQWLGAIGRPVTAIHYVGDLDRPGLDALAASDRQARSAGLPAVVAAPGLHAAMLDAATRFGHAHGWPYGAACQDPRDSERLLVLPLDVRSAVGAILSAGRRIPEEVLGPVEFDNAWSNTAG